MFIIPRTMAAPLKPAVVNEPPRRFLSFDDGVAE
jgi:hypothetical protein